MCFVDCCYNLLCLLCFPGRAWPGSILGLWRALMPIAPILEMFAASPVKPLQKHMQEAVVAAELMLPFFAATQSGDWEGAASCYQSIRDAEHKADALKRDLRVHLPKGLLMSMSRSDVLGLLKAQEKLPNLAKDIAGLVLGRKLVLPQDMASAFLAFVECVVEAAQQSHSATARVSRLMEIGFKAGRQIKSKRRFIV